VAEREDGGLPGGQSTDPSRLASAAERQSDSSA
jgi:hypothetical protein